MDKWLHYYFYRRKNIFFRIFVHSLFWISVVALNWVINYGSFPQTSGSEKYYYLLNHCLIIGFTYGFTFLFNSGRHWWLIFLVLPAGLILCMYFNYYTITFLDQFYPEETGFMHRYKAVLGHIPASEIWWSRKALGVTFNTTIYLLYLPLVLKLSYEVIKKVYLERKLKEENLKLELDFLRAQVNPHFLFNSLNNIYSQMPDSEGPAAGSLLKLAGMLRYTLYEAGKEWVLLSRELDFIQQYVELEKLRLPPHKQLHLEIETDKGEPLIKPLLLITFVENALKHGIQKTNGEARADIKVSLSGNVLLFSCMNSVAAAAGPPGLGLDNTLRRLEHYYAGRYTYDRVCENGVYEVNLRLEL